MILTTIGRKKPTKLYHYTDLASFIGIVSNNEFWLSNLYFQNDKHEYQLGLNLFRDSLKTFKRKYSDNKKITIFLNTLDSGLNLIENCGVYTLSLSEESDLLSQWRGYADNCRGVRLELSAFLEQIEKGVQLLPCLYRNEEHVEYVSYLLEHSINLFNTTKENGKTNKNDFLEEEKPYSDAIEKAGNYFISTVNVACSIIKHGSFSEEREWRLIVFNSQEIYYRQRSHYIIPYIKKKINNLNHFMTDIMICSSPEKDTTSRSIRFILDNKGFNTTKISESLIPYRL